MLISVSNIPPQRLNSNSNMKESSDLTAMTVLSPAEDIMPLLSTICSSVSMMLVETVPGSLTRELISSLARSLRRMMFCLWS